MRKVYVSATYLFLFDDKELEMTESSEEELMDEVGRRVDNILFKVQENHGLMYNDLEITVCEEKGE